MTNKGCNTENSEVCGNELKTSSDPNLDRPYEALNVGDAIASGNAGWTFGGNVADTFDTHVLKSIPLYETGHDLTCKLSDYFLTDGSTAYDIGTSTGSLLTKLVEHNQSKKIRWVGLDTEENMISKARQRLEHHKGVELEVADVIEYAFEKSDLIVSYYCLQFIRPKYRQALMDKIYGSLNWGGAFLLFEKVRGPDARFQDIFTTLYADYKLDQGYSPSEIFGKTRSLKGVLEPFSTQGNFDLLRRAGFQDIVPVMKYLCFEGLLCIK